MIPNKYSNLYVKNNVFGTMTKKLPYVFKHLRIFGETDQRINQKHIEQSHNWNEKPKTV